MRHISAVVVAIMIVVGGIVGALTLPLQVMVILGVSGVAAFIGWLATSYRYPVVSRRVIAIYLCSIAFQFIHMSEEYVAGFPHELTELFDTRDWSERSFLLTFVFGFDAVWLLAGAGALYQVRVANYFLWFYALGAGLINAISHFVFPILEGGYFPGVYTAGGHFFFSALLIWALIVESRMLRREQERVPPRPTGGSVIGQTDSSL